MLANLVRLQASASWWPRATKLALWGALAAASHHSSSRSSAWWSHTRWGRLLLLPSGLCQAVLKAVMSAGGQTGRQTRKQGGGEDAGASCAVGRTKWLMHGQGGWMRQEP